MASAPTNAGAQSKAGSGVDTIRPCSLRGRINPVEKAERRVLILPIGPRPRAMRVAVDFCGLQVLLPGGETGPSPYDERRALGSKAKAYTA